ncbi:hypothetical protein J3A78_005034 [Streptomyces sp. PvR006]|nr:hypothetical protein [Streptomyces sp. PvR006]MBP2584556.1 hypothetical protein [Streptomyces sp. PvR006]
MREKQADEALGLESATENVGDGMSGHADERQLESGAIGNDVTGRHAEKYERTRERCQRGSRDS